MSRGFPVIEARVTRKFCAQHSLPQIGNADLHWHEYEVTVGYRHEIAPTLGATKALNDVLSSVDPVIAKLSGAVLNDLWIAPPTAENMALWILRQLPGYFDFVEVHAYDVLTVRASRQQARFEWLDWCAGMPVPGVP